MTPWTVIAKTGKQILTLALKNRRFRSRPHQRQRVCPLVSP